MSVFDDDLTTVWPPVKFFNSAGIATTAEAAASAEEFNFTNHVLVAVNGTVTKSKTLALYDVLIPSIGVFVILLNLLVVISSGLILKNGQKNKTTYLFLGNVAMADLVTGIAVVFGQATPEGARDFYLCSLQIGMIVSSTLASVFSVGLIAVDRYLYILHGLQYQRWLHSTKARILILITWFIGIVIGFLPMMGWHGEDKPCWFIKLAPKYLILLTVLAGVIPLIVVFVLYGIILYHALMKVVELRNVSAGRNTTTSSGLRISRKTSNSSTTNPSGDVTKNPQVADAVPPELGDGVRQRKGIFRTIFMKKPNNEIKPPSKWKAIKVVLFVTASFFVTWVPYFVTSLVYSFCDDKESPRCKAMSIWLASPLAILGFANSLLNPIIYAWWHPGFRKFVMAKLCKGRIGPAGASSTSGTTSTKQTGNSASSRKASTQSNGSGSENDAVRMQNVDLKTRL